MSDSEHLTVNIGATLSEHPTEDGPVVSRVTEIELSENTLSVEATVSALRSAIETDMRDSYPSVFLWCDGDTIAITDHKTPIEGADYRRLDDYVQPVARAEVIKPTDEAQYTQADRDDLLTALDEFGSDETVEVLIEDEWPVVFKHGETGVGVAPKLSVTVMQQEV